MAEMNAAGASTGLSDDAACGLAYLTFIPAIIFLVVAPYNTSAKVRFHAWQSIFLAATWFCVWIINMVLAFIPIFGWLLALVLILGLVVLWLITMIMAFQGKRFMIPLIGNLAAKQAGS